jgi:DNA-binding HxlR family transcriptional regulator
MRKRLSARFGCPVELTLEILAGKWKPVILAHLKDGALRYGELRARVPRLSDKVLSERLRDLEEQGLVHRTRADGAAHPVYRLTERGNSLRPVLEQLYAWGETAAPTLGVTIDLLSQAGDAAARNDAVHRGSAARRPRPKR